MSTHAEVIEIAKGYGIGNVIWRSELRSIAAALQPGEKILFMWQNSLHVTPLPSGKTQKRGGIGFISNHRAMHLILAQIEEFPLGEIHAIERQGKHLFFNTSITRVCFRNANSMLQRALNDAIAGYAAAPVAAPAPAPARNTAPPPLTIAVNCPRCGASVMATPGQAGKCDYCDGLVQA